MRLPIAVITGDIHFTTKTLELASSVVTQALDKSKELGVPFIMNGDTLDAKAVMRGECVNRLIELLSDTDVIVIVNRGNHDQLHEKSQEHTLNFLRPYSSVVQSPVYLSEIDSWVIPYQHDPNEFSKIVSAIPKGSRLIVHQGLASSDMGHYVHDVSAITKDVVADYRTIGSHYHRAQDIKCGRPRKGAIGLFSYIGSPYTTSFAEAADGPKGFQILYDDGLLELVPTNLRKHVVIEATVDALGAGGVLYPELPRLDDLVWLKLSGPSLALENHTKDGLRERLGLPNNYRLDKIPTDAPPPVVDGIEKKSGIDILDELVDGSKESDSHKAALKQLAREVMS